MVRCKSRVTEKERKRERERARKKRVVSVVVVVMVVMVTLTTCGPGTVCSIQIRYRLYMVVNAEAQHIKQPGTRATGGPYRQARIVPS